MSCKAKISRKDERILHTKSGNRCAICKAVLVESSATSDTCIGENAHIYGEKPGSARYDSSKSSAFVNSESNLIFLCCNCHEKIDSDVASFSAEKLLYTKKEHESWVEEKLQEKSIAYSFAELEVLTRYIVNCGSNVTKTQNYNLLKIDKKL